jgi:hypothetical protein
MEDFNKRETATLLAALRFWQQAVEHVGIQDLDEYSIATDEGTVDPLSTLEIDELCDRINQVPIADDEERSNGPKVKG